jgi:putative membrane protein
LLPPYAIHLGLIYLSWTRWGLAIDNGLVVVRKGIIGVDHILMPAFKIQEVGRVRTPLMKRHNLSTLSFSSASRNVTVPFLPDSMVREVIDYCLYETESTGRSWM